MYGSMDAAARAEAERNFERMRGGVFFSAFSQGGARVKLDGLAAGHS